MTVKVAKKLAITPSDISLQIDYNGKIAPLYAEDLILSNGSYNIGEKFMMEGDLQYNGRFVAIFERKEKNYFDYLFATKPEYDISYFITMEWDGMMNSTFYCTDSSVADINGDKTDDILLNYCNILADRRSNSIMALTKIKGNWTMLEPDIDGLLENLQRKDTKIRQLLLDELPYVNDSEEHTACSFPFGGYVTFGKNPLDDSPRYCMRIALLKQGEYMQQKHDYVYIMYKYNQSGKLEIDKSWNGGDPFISGDPLNNADLYNENFWGTNIDGILFYSL